MISAVDAQFVADGLEFGQGAPASAIRSVPPRLAR